MKKAAVIGAMIVGAVFLCGCNQQAVATDHADIWLADYNAALKQAAAGNKYVLVDFSGSDWCGWCIKLDREVFSQKEFIDYAAANLICVLVDFPRSKELPESQKAANQALAERYRIQGFPTVLILDPKGEVVKQTGYRPGGADEYVKFLADLIAADKSK